MSSPIAVETHLAVIGNAVGICEQPPLACISSYKKTTAGGGMLSQSLPRQREIWLGVNTVDLDDCIHAGVLHHSLIMISQKQTSNDEESTICGWTDPLSNHLETKTTLNAYMAAS